MKPARITRLLFLSLALMLAMFLTACGPSNTVRLLSPAPAVNPVLPAPNAPRVTVVPFTDNRQDTTNLGVRRDGSAFVASDDLAQWVSRGLADELRRQGVTAAEIVGVLRRQGVQVSYAMDENQARSGNPDYIVTGTVEQAWLREVSATELATSMRATYRLAPRSGRVVKETLNSSQNRSGIPTGGAAEEIMLNSMRELVQPMARKIKTIVDGK